MRYERPMRARGWFRCSTCHHRARVVVSDSSLDELFSAVLREPLERGLDREPAAERARYREAPSAAPERLPRLDEHPALARLLSLARCPTCGARDRRALGLAWARAALRGLGVLVAPPLVLGLLALLRLRFADLVRFLDTEPDARAVVLVLVGVSAALAVVAFSTARPRLSQIDRAVHWEETERADEASASQGRRT